MNKSGVAGVFVCLFVICAHSLLAETATMGETGTSSNYFNTVNRIRGIVRTAPDDGILDSIYVHVANVQTGAVAKGVLYDSTSLQLIDSTAEKELAVDGGSFHWEGFAFANAGIIESGKTYLLAVFIGPTYVGVGRDPTTDSRYYVDYTYASGVPQSLSGGVWATDQVHSIYVVYTRDSGDSTSVNGRRRRVTAN